VQAAVLAKMAEEQSENEARERCAELAQPRSAAPVSQAAPVEAISGRALHLLVLNIKGGSGKSTVATTLAAHFASLGERVALVDHDPIATSLSWARQRPKDVAPVHPVDASPNAARGHRFNWRTQLPQDATLLVADTPGGMDCHKLRELLDWADLVLIPVLPSSIDIRAASRFMSDVLRHPRFRNRRQRIAVIANRVTRLTSMHYKLDRFLSTLRVPFLSTISDSEAYPTAYEQAVGLSELFEPMDEALREWQPVLEWIDSYRPSGRDNACTVCDSLDLPQREKRAAE
jgi:chromosome partitioning protein